MPQLDVKLNNRNYTLACEKGEEMRLRQLAEYLDGRIINLSKAMGGNVQDTQLFMLTCFMLADELAEAKNGSKSDTPVDSGANDNLAQRVEQLTERLNKIVGKVAV